MRTIEINLYKFEELSKDAKQVAINNNLDINTDYDWWDYNYEDASNEEVKITHFDIDKKSIGLEMESYSHTAKLIIDNHGHECITYKVAYSFLETLDHLHKQEDYDEDAEEEAYQKFKEDLGKCYLDLLRQEYDFRTSEEAVKETLIANEYEFTVDGLRFKY